MNEDDSERLMLTAGLWPVEWKLSVPAIVALLLYGLNGVMDAVFVGRVARARDAVLPDDGTRERLPRLWHSRQQEGRAEPGNKP